MALLKRKGSEGVRAPDVTRDLLGHVFEGRYQIVAQIGQGGIGVVYRATDTKLAGRPVAVKVLSEMMGLRTKQRRRFEREAKALAALGHPNIVSVIDYGVAEQTPYLVMELLEGRPLSQVIAREAPLEPARALGLMAQLLAGLGYAHERAIVHRDLKPGNLFVQTLPGMGERVKLLDFGLVKFLEPTDESTITASGEIFGTPGYMPPEQILGKSVDARADVYAACVLLYELLSGHKPYSGPLMEVVQRQLSGHVPRLADAGTGRSAHPALEALLARGLSARPADRHRDARELAQALASLPTPCVTTLSPEARARHTQEAHEAVTRVDGASDVPTNAVAAPRPRARATTSHPGVISRMGAALAGLVRGLLRAGAFVLALASALLIVAAIVVIYVLRRHGPEEGREVIRRALPAITAPTTAREVPDESARERPTSMVPVTHERTAARDPWRGPVPVALRKARTVMLRGKHGDERTLTFLRRYNADHPSDPTGHLLLGGFYTNRGWFSDALQQYDLAFQIDPRARGDGHAQADLLALAAQPAEVWSRARTLLLETYGRELVAPLAQTQKKTSPGPLRTRLDELAAEVSGLP